MPGIDFFDVDNTITSSSSGARFITMAIRKGVLPVKLLFILPYYSFTYRLGLLRLKAYADGFPYLKGVSKADLESIAHESFETKLRADIFPEAVALIGEKKRAGERVALATSSLDIIVEPLARFLGVTDVIATTLEFDNAICTGRIQGKPLFRREKQKRVLEFIAEAGVSAEDCSFYSDSIYDLPLLEEVGNPVAVNPDFRLRRIARRRGWKIVDFSRHG
jgi:HAD superfamily hydrolase (TIGR01490 family)